jgi:exonuclease SbcC
LDNERAAAETRRHEAQSRLSGQSVLYETAKTKFASGENSLRKQKGVLDEILGTRTIAEWRKALEELIERKTKQEQIGEILRRRAENMEVGEKLKARLATLGSSRKECQKSIAEQKDKIRNTEKEVRYLEVQTELVQRIEDLEEARGRLRDGEPCPLCGAAEHPYASGNIPQADEVRLAMLQVKDELAKDNEALSALRIKNAQIDQEALQAEEEQIRLLRDLQVLEGRLTEDLAALQLILPMDTDPLTGIARQKQKTEEILQKTRLTVERAEKMEREHNLAREEHERNRDERDQLARSQQEAEFVKETATREWEHLAQDIRLLDEELKNIRLDLVHQVAPFGFKSLPDQRPEKILEALEARSRKWQEQHRSRTELEKELSVQERDVHHMRASLDKLNLELKDKVEAAKKLRAERDALRQQRVSLFGEKDPNAEEASQAALVEAAQKQVEAKREEREIVLQEFSNMHSRMEELGKSIHVRADSLQKAEISFKKQLVANDFRNEDAYLSACLPEAERKVLQERAQALSVERAELDARQMDKKFGLEELRRRHLTDSSLDETRERKDQTATRVKELQQSIGALRSRLKNEEDFALKKQDLMTAIEKQRREYHRWEKLHDLIGGADGQKYRNFAQSLTFEMVIRHANQQLQKMMDRYFLIGDEGQTLGLRVVDNYQAGEIRSSKNLSGGESFIVSLALALGLSQMASQKVRVDSLFLDEGFGTLDEEALDMALSTLTSLRQEGKLIGVISHVEALKERIGTQIEVIPQGYGRSVIRAPGCVGPLE